jgi:hypothetical protein
MILIVFYRAPFNPFASEDGRCVGWTEKQIKDRFGEPSHQWSGFYGKPPATYTLLHPSAVSMVYERFTGTLYVSVEPVNGEWVCFECTWAPNGCIID